MNDLTIRIDNIYDDGYQQETIVSLVAPLPPARNEWDDLDEWNDWWNEHVFPFTGTNSGRENVNAGYFAEIIAGAQDAVGLTYEWT